jgi:putative salt-induced outer membrane protein YdiY
MTGGDQLMRHLPILAGAVLSTMLVSLSASPAFAQAAPAAAGQTAPVHPAWHGSASAGVALAGGVQAQRGYQLAGDVRRPFSDGGSFVANAARDYQKVTFPSPALLADRTTLSGGADLNTSKKTVAMARSMYMRDKLLYVDSRYEELVGFGLHLSDASKRFDLQVVPGVSIFKQDLSYSDDRDWQGGGGVYEKFTGKINAAWSVGNSFRFRRNWTKVDRSVESVASLTGAIIKPLGLQLEYQYNYESIVPPGFPNYLQVVSAGLRFQF